MILKSFDTRFWYAVVVLVLACPESWSQPFTTVLELPPVSIGDNQTVGSNTQVNVRAGGRIGERFTAGGSASNVEVNLYGGSIGPVFFTYPGGTLNVYDGQVEVFLQNYGGTVNLYGGVIGADYQSWSEDAVINVFGGSIGDFFELNAGTANLHGGTFDHPFFSGDAVNLFGSGFTLDGQPITGLTPGQPTLITERGGAILDGLFEDGSPFSFGLFGDDDNNDPFVRGRDFFADDASVTVTLVAAYATGDFDGDGFVSQGDLDLVLLNWGSGTLPSGWVASEQFDGQAVSQNELDAVLLNWGTGVPPVSTSVPEPTTAAIATLIGLGLARRGRRL